MTKTTLTRTFPKVHKARNIVERCPKKRAASVRSTLRKAWEMEDASVAERLIKDLAKRMAREAPGVSGSPLEGLDEILTVEPSQAAGRAATLAGLHQCHREHAGHDPGE